MRSSPPPLRCRINTGVRLHPDMPVLAFLGLMHLGNATILFFLVEGAAAISVALTMVPSRMIRPHSALWGGDRLEDSGRQFVLLQPATARESSRGVGCRLARQIEVHEAVGRLLS